MKIKKNIVFGLLLSLGILFVLPSPAKATGTITVIDPSGGINWNAGSVHDITWSSTGNITNVDIELFNRNGGGELDAVIATGAPNTGSYSWTIPFALSNSSTYQILITDSSDPSSYEGSSFFTITSPYNWSTITVTAPLGGTLWMTGSSYFINWTCTGALQSLNNNTNISIYLSGGGLNSMLLIANSAPNNLFYKWNVSTSLSTNQNYKIYIYDSSVVSIIGWSEFFTIMYSTMPGIYGYEGNLFFTSMIFGIIYVVWGFRKKSHRT
nr:Ser-Thr-rich GPI-anchored membrane family protein [Candidatus Sigynarchaeota archaeon]